MKPGRKAPGKWTSQAAMDLQVPVPVIDAAVAMRDLSAFKEEREAASRILAGPPVEFKGHGNRILEQLERALYAATLIAYAQGMVLLQAASDGLRVQPQPVGSGPHLAGGLHHPLGPAGGYPAGYEEPP